MESVFHLFAERGIDSVYITEIANDNGLTAVTRYAVDPVHSGTAPESELLLLKKKILKEFLR